MLCDNPLATSGVGCQANHLINGLLKKNRWSFRVLGGAIKHADYRIQYVNDDYLIKPVDGFGDPELIRELLIKEKPDAIFLFTDPRFFMWLWQMEDEIHQICPIVYWHVWDNDPYPKFNDVLYQSTDLINCHSHLTYRLVSEHHPHKTNFIPHALPKNVFKKHDDATTLMNKIKILGPDRADHFVCSWVNRNARRKMPGNVMLAWKLFLDKLQATYGHKKATLLMHTHPSDPEGQNLISIADDFGITQNVIYSTGRVSFEEMAVLYNISDFSITLPIHEGFGLGTLEAMQCGKPIIAVKTGGLTRQVVDHRDGSHNGIALDPDVRDLVGGQSVPYIYEDHVSCHKAADAIWQLFEMGHEARVALGEKARNYVLSEFDIDHTVNEWDRTMHETITRWKQTKHKRWETITL